METQRLADSHEGVQPLTLSVSPPISRVESASGKFLAEQLCPSCHKQILEVSPDEFRAHQLICAEANAADWVQLPDRRWGRTKGSKLPFKFGPARDSKLSIVRAEYCHACGQEHKASSPCPTLQRSWPRCRVANCPTGREPHFPHTKVLLENNLVNWC